MSRCRSFVFTLATFASVLVASSAHAGYYPRLFTSTRAQGMGGAYVALADDEGSIFLNPAGLAGAKGFTFNYGSVDNEISADTILAGLDGLSAFSDLSGDTLNQLMGKNIYSHTQFSPNIVMPGFGIAFLSDHQFALLQKNIANPDIGLGFQSTNGLQIAFGFSVLPKRKRLRHDLRVGVAGKMLWRRGGFYHLDFLELLNLTQAPLPSLHELTGNYGVGYGADLGTQYLFHATKTLTLSTALVMTDVGDTSFDSAQAQAQKSNLTFGLAASYKLKRIKANLLFDYNRILQDVDLRSRMHTGIELQVPFFTFMAGLNQLNLTYGASFDLWLFRITASSYGEERATFRGQDTERRYALRVAAKMGF